MNRKGFTFIEVMIVTAILAILSTAALVYLLPTIDKSRDGRRKSDMHKIANALEEYSNDKGGYPQTMSSTDCGSHATLSPYLGTVPCEPSSKTAYLYVSGNCNGTVCKTYNLFTKLSNPKDPDIAALGCDDANGCYSVGGKVYNYGKAVGNAVELN